MFSFVSIKLLFFLECLTQSNNTLFISYIERVKLCCSSWNCCQASELVASSTILIDKSSPVSVCKIPAYMTLEQTSAT